ncbi:hypothetical protein BTZ20_1685 [Rhodococcus sp. MTM3W5.2]|nr:hypothetical protein BTZ20_1685 [Rhodococcus sp. MTM3W5.2]
MWRRASGGMSMSASNRGLSRRYDLSAAQGTERPATSGGKLMRCSD